MRQRSKTNSRHGEDIAFRRRYMMAHDYCQLTPHLWNLDRELARSLGLNFRETATDPHHLFGGAGRRVDCEFNLLAVCRPVHLWAHANLKDSRVLGVWLKWKSGCFDALKFKAISGKYLAGWLIGAEPSEAFLPLWRELCDNAGGK